MKKKGPIPDFSRTKPTKATAKDLTQKTATPPPTPLRANKPQATSAKSGQRGR